MNNNPATDEVKLVVFEEGKNGALMTRVDGHVSFVHHNYTGILPRPGETWKVVVIGATPSKKSDSVVYFVKPITRVSGQGSTEQVAQEYHDAIAVITKNPEEKAELLAAIRTGIVAPTSDALYEFLHQKKQDDARQRNFSAQRANIARILLRQYGFKILREEVMPNGEYRFITHQQYRAYWYPQREGEYLVVMTSPTRGYILSMELAGWYATPNAQDPKPPKLAQNWHPDEVLRRLREE